MAHDDIAADSQNKLESVGRGIRTTCQCIGLGLMLIGAALGLSMLFKVLRAVDEPKALSQPVQGMVEQIDGEKLVLRKGTEQEIPFGKLLAALLVMGWYAVAVWLCIGVIYVGARIVAFNFDERRQVKLLVREFLEKVREDAAPRGGPKGTA